MSEATDKRVVSCVLDIIYNVTYGKVKTPKRIGLAVLVRILTGSADLVKVLQIHVLSRVGDSFDIANGLLLDVENFLCCLHFSVNW
jgi:hypothetical protein